MRSKRSFILPVLALLVPFGATGQDIQFEGGTTYRERVPEEYIVEQGDTLWDICEEFFQEPWRWPTVWALNPHVTNPHWIYPGDVLRLRLPAQRAAVDGVVLDPIRYTTGTTTAMHVSLNEGFIAEKQLDRAGTLRYSTEAKRWLATGDPVYVEFKRLDDIRIGQRFSVYKTIKDVYHPESGAFLGQKIQVLGVIEVDRVDEHVATGRVLRAFTEIERGAQATPLLDHYHQVSPKQNLIDLEAVVVESFLDIVELGQFHSVFLDKGAKDGVQVGNRFFVLRRGDGFLELSTDTRKKLPWEQIGEVLVVETQDRNSTGLITRSAIEIKVGDRVTMERSY